MAEVLQEDADLINGSSDWIWSLGLRVLQKDFTVQNFERSQILWFYFLGARTWRSSRAPWMRTWSPVLNRCHVKSQLSQKLFAYAAYTEMPNISLLRIYFLSTNLGLRFLWTVVGINQQCFKSRLRNLNISIIGYKKFLLDTAVMFANLVLGNFSGTCGSWCKCSAESCSSNDVEYLLSCSLLSSEIVLSIKNIEEISWICNSIKFKYKLLQSLPPDEESMVDLVRSVCSLLPEESLLRLRETEPSPSICFTTKQDNHEAQLQIYIAIFTFTSQY